jgi:plasmid maintenance system killer protein
MLIEVGVKKLKEALEDDRLCRRWYGAEMAKKIRLRMDALYAADSLADLWPPGMGPERCHELKGDMAGLFSVDLKHPYRLLFKPIDLPAALPVSDEKERWKSITAIEIVEIKDTHG